jgi:hypothetical protein
MENSETTRSYKSSLDSAEGYLKYVFIAGIVFNVASSLSDQMMRYMMFLIRALQIILHLPLFRVVIPSNFTMLNSIIAPIMMFDILDNSNGVDISLIMGFEEQDANILDQMKNIGYTSNNCALNLGTIYFLVIFYLMQLTLTLIIAIYNKFTGKGGKILRKLTKQLFFSEILIMSIEGFIEIYISGYIQVTQPLYTTFGESHSVYLGYSLLIIGMFFMPSSLIWTFIQDRPTLETPEFKAMWGQCYAEVSLRNNWSRAFYLIHIGRRFLFITIGIFITNPTYQLLSLFYLNLLMTLYKG